MGTGVHGIANPWPALRKLDKPDTTSANSPKARVLSFFDMFHMKPVSIGCPKIYALGSVRGFCAVQKVWKWSCDTAPKARAG